MWFLNTMTRCWGRYLRARGKGSFGTGFSNLPYRVQHIPTQQTALLTVITIVCPHIPSLVCVTTRNAEAWTRRQKGISIRMLFTLGPWQNDLLFIQNWVNRISFAETSKHCTVQWFHKQLFNSPLPDFPNKWSLTSFFVENAVIILFMALGAGRVEWSRRTREVTLKWLVPLWSIPGTLCPDSRTIC